ncbi:sensor histidine kinase [Streptomyces sp. NPDC053792]|uniref:sensor histidine kinase n=1 Tax=unclassified Streptomyces TaxID=2593676 RepID=UPI00342DBE3F
MIKATRTLLRRSTYSGALFGYGAVLLSLPLLSLALVPAMAWRSAPEGLRAAAVLLVWAVLIGLVGLARTTRRVLVLSARRLLAVSLPDAAAVRASASRADRWRTPLWLLLHVTIGWTGALASGVLLVAGLTLPGGWLDAELGLSLFGRTVRVTGGWQSWAVAPVCLLLAAAVCAVVAKALRWSAPRLLGPSAAERLALAAERERRLAERNRLAHELHDSIGHTLTTTTIQAAVAGEVLSADPVAARAALRSIEESARAALEDLDYVLGVLREREAETAPVRTLADLPGLLDRLRHAGAVVEPDLSGDLAHVQGTLSRAAYRILQEGLTNAMRHGAGGPIEVRVAAGAEVLELGVVNATGAAVREAGAEALEPGVDVLGPGVTDPSGPDGPEPRVAAPARRPGAFPTSGHGLPGLAERVRLLHGEIEAGPDGPRRWRLAVRLPVRLPA